MSTFTAHGSLIDITEIYHEPGVFDTERGKQIRQRFPDASLTEVPSHWKIEVLHQNEENVSSWNRIKRNVLVVGHAVKNRYCRRNCRSTDFIAPSHANGCAMACNYCYVARRKSYANPITVFVDIERLTKYLSYHINKQGIKPEPNQCDPSLWTYDIGENNDCSVDAMISDNIKDIVALFRTEPTAKASFATKYVNRDLLDYDPQGHTRVRFSLMPQNVATFVDVRCSKISDRIQAINDFVAAGYEVHINLSPVIIYDGWQGDYIELFKEIDDTLNDQSKAQLAAEIIFLTHNERLHDINMRWHPSGEGYLWTPERQQRKLSQNGMWNIRYRNNWKRDGVETISQLIEEHIPYCKIRYAF